MNRVYLKRGTWLAIGTLLVVGLVFLVLTASSYDGRCGGFFPGVSVRHPCTFAEFMAGDVLAIALIMATTFWPLLVALLVLLPLAGYLLDRKVQMRSIKAAMRRQGSP